MTKSIKEEKGRLVTDRSVRYRDPSIFNRLKSFLDKPSTTQPELHVLRLKSGPYVIVAIDHQRPGALACGGIRLVKKVSLPVAINTAIGLSTAMSAKNAIARLPFGGAKVVVILGEGKDPYDVHASWREPFLLELALCLMQFNYICAPDMCTSSEDMAVMARVNPKVTSKPVSAAGMGDPAASTAQALYIALTAIAELHLGKAIAQLRFAVQGLGSVGGRIARMLLNGGASMVCVADVRPELCVELQREFGETAVKIVDTDEVLYQDVDIVVPCATGQLFDVETVSKVVAPVVAGAANDQLKSPKAIQAFERAGKLYFPEFAINFGGIIRCYVEVAFSDPRDRDIELARLIGATSFTVKEILERSRATGKSAYHIATAMAAEILDSESRMAA